MGLSVGAVSHQRIKKESNKQKKQTTEDPHLSLPTYFVVLNSSVRNNEPQVLILLSTQPTQLTAQS